MTALDVRDYIDFDFAVDAKLAAKPKIGLIVLATDYTIEPEIGAAFAASGVEVHAARIAMDPEVTPQTLAAMGPRITETTELLLPGDRLDVVGYGCTSASIVLGEDAVAAAVHAVQPGARVTTPITAAFAAFRALSARRIAVLTPYTRAVNERLQAYIEAAGFEVPIFGSFNEPMDPVVATISRDSIRGGIVRLTEKRDVDMVFVSCTSMRFADQIAETEAEIGLPVTTSNHALGWHMLHLAGIPLAADGSRLYAAALHDH
ncbi:MAG: Asp/Glu racemase [Pseudomonadota bacterium]